MSDRGRGMNTRGGYGGKWGNGGGQRRFGGRGGGGMTEGPGQGQGQPIRQIYGFNQQQQQQQQQQQSNSNSGSWLSQKQSVAPVTPPAPNHNDKLLHSTMCSVGCQAKIQVRSGCAFEGVLSTFSSDPTDSGVLLRVCSQTRKGWNADTEKQPPLAEQLFQAKDLVMVEVFDVALEAPEELSFDQGFATDVAISAKYMRKGGGIKERKLEKWVDDTTFNDSTFEELERKPYNLGDFDQFAVNRDKFHIVSEFREEEYTTVINPETCKITPEEAERIAGLILKDNHSTGNIHIREERGLAIDDSGIGEEELYSSVVRQPEPPQNAVPPPAPPPQVPLTQPPPPQMQPMPQPQPPPPGPGMPGMPGMLVGVGVSAPGVGPMPPMRGSPHPQQSPSLPQQSRPQPSPTMMQNVQQNPRYINHSTHGNIRILPIPMPMGQQGQHPPPPPPPKHKRNSRSYERQNFPYQNGNVGPRPSWQQNAGRPQTIPIPMDPMKNEGPVPVPMQAMRQGQGQGQAQGVPWGQLKSPENTPLSKSPLGTPVAKSPIMSKTYPDSLDYTGTKADINKEFRKWKETHRKQHEQEEEQKRIEELKKFQPKIPMVQPTQVGSSPSRSNLTAAFSGNIQNEIERSERSGRSSVQPSPSLPVRPTSSFTVRKEDRSDSRNDVRSDSRNDIRNESRSEVRSDLRNEASVEPRNESRNDSRNETRTESRNESRSHLRNNSRGEFSYHKRNDSRGEYHSHSRKNSRSAIRGDYLQESDRAASLTTVNSIASVPSGVNMQESGRPDVIVVKRTPSQDFSNNNINTSNLSNNNNNMNNNISSSNYNNGNNSSHSQHQHNYSNGNSNFEQHYMSRNSNVRQNQSSRNSSVKQRTDSITEDMMEDMSRTESKTSLNPNAPEFSLNPAASEFTPPTSTTYPANVTQPSPALSNKSGTVSRASNHRRIDSNGSQQGPMQSYSHNVPNAPYSKPSRPINRSQQGSSRTAQQQAPYMYPYPPHPQAYPGYAAPGQPPMQQGYYIYPAAAPQAMPAQQQQQYMGQGRPMMPYAMYGMPPAAPHQFPHARMPPHAMPAHYANMMHPAAMGPAYMAVPYGGQQQMAGHPPPPPQGRADGGQPQQQQQYQQVQAVQMQQQPPPPPQQQPPPPPHTQTPTHPAQQQQYMVTHVHQPMH